LEGEINGLEGEIDCLDGEISFADFISLTCRASFDGEICFADFIWVTSFNYWAFELVGIFCLFPLDGELFYLIFM
jgi:hypothetical protein